MPIKHQTESYRNRRGLRFECTEDLCDPSKGDLRWQAQEMVRGFRDQGRKAFFEKQGGFYRVFVEDTIKASGERISFQSAGTVRKR